MAKKIVNTAVAPAAIGPYSQAVSVSGDLCLVSGQLPIDPETGEFAGSTIAEQTKQSLENIRAILEADGMGMEHVVKTTVLLKSIGDFGAMNEVYGQYFKDNCPARAAFQVAALPKDALVEIEAIAVKNK